MKLSIAWIFDHINADWQNIDVHNLVKKFNAITAEVENVALITLDIDSISIAHVTTIAENNVTVTSPEWKIEFQLPSRHDALIGNWYLIKKNKTGAIWLATNHIGSSKEHLIPTVTVDESMRTGTWKKTVTTTDHILEVDNKSITHRPDMWSHRGFAREIAAILDLPLKPLSEFLHTIPVIDHHDAKKEQLPFALSIDARACSRFAGLYIPAMVNKPSTIAMAFRLACVDAKPINAIIDCTNYVMLDISQPLHAFDADKISSKKIMPRMANAGETLELLDGQTITLTSNDLVISDGTQPLALAGIMGGASTAISSGTTSIFVEAACFDATTIRRSSTRLKLRTDASARFEKTLDPNQNINALMRFAYLAHQMGICASINSPIISCGQQVPEKTIPILYNFLNDRLGASVDPERATTILKKLEFRIDPIDDTIFIVTVPSFRGTKDVTIKEDILEEVGRFYGYTNIVTTLPYKQCTPSNLYPIYQRRLIKTVLVNTVKMHELESYAFYDEDFLRRLKWEPTDAIHVQNPISENWRRLITSLIPNLFKAIEQNDADHEHLRFFEWARIWHKDHTSGTVKAIEQKSLVGIFFHKKEVVDFYQVKAELTRLFDALYLPVTWHQVQQPTQSWFVPYQTAQIHHGDTIIGTMGIIDTQFLSPISNGFACAFELEGDFLLHYKAPLKRYQEPSKYPAVERDISVLISLSYTTDFLRGIISQANPNITHAELIDCFTKSEWTDTRALTFRFMIQNKEKTLTKEEIDTIYNAVTHVLRTHGATIR